VTAFPFLFIERMGVRTDHYGYYYGAIVLAYFFGCLAVNRAAGYWSSDQLLAAGLLFCAVGGLSLPLVIASGYETPGWVAASQCFFTFGLGLALATAPVRAFDVCRAGHGYAAAMLGALEMGGGGVGAFLVGLLHDGSARPIVIVLGGASLLAVVLYLAARPWRCVSRPT
jgi:DHA1 family bicyclomycin/chloramphenicol resistance-like MFS transporter